MQKHNFGEGCRGRLSVYLGSVGQEYGRGQVAGDAAQDVNDGDAQPTSQLLQVPQDGHLERHRHQAVEDPGRRGQGV